MENIYGICLNWMNDPVYAIREADCKLMKKLYDIFKGEEFEKKLLEKLNEMRVNTNYLIRNTVVILAKVILYIIIFRNLLMMNLILIFLKRN